VAVLHLLSLPLLLGSLLTGLRLSIGHGLLPPALDAALPMGRVADWHLLLALAWVLVLFGYLGWRRLRQRNRAAVAGRPVLSRAARWHRHLLVLIWSALVGLIASGAVLYLSLPGLSGRATVILHLSLALALCGLLPLHLLVTAWLRGFSGWWAAFWPRGASRYRRWTQGLALGAALLTAAWAAVPPSWLSTPLRMTAIPTRLAPQLDGVTDDQVWALARPVSVQTVHGANSASGVAVTLRAVHDGDTAYFAVTWPDPTRSGVHLPLQKTADGWRVIHEGFDTHDERRWYEDKLALMFSRSHAPAGGSFHYGAKGAARGQHAMQSGLVDVWHWKSLRNPLGTLDDSHFGPAQPRRAGEPRYTAGYRADPAEAGAIVHNWQWFSAERVLPKRLPRSPEQLLPFRELPDPEQPGAQIDWSLSWYQTRPYTAELDVYPVGTLMPSVLIRDGYEGDRASVRAFAEWRDGEWTLELARALKAPGEFDLDLHSGLAVWVAVFDHSQTRHSLHVRPLSLVIDP
jgi:hypothetical protein